MVTKKNPVKTILVYLIIGILLVLFLFPIYWMIIASFKDNKVLMHIPPQFYPTFSTFKNYISIITNAKYLRYIKNSLIISFMTVIIDLAFSIFAGYSLSRFRYPGRKTIMTLTLSSQVFPGIVIIISLYGYFSKLGLLNTYWGMAIADVAMTLPLSVWMMKSFCDTIPKSLDEAAKVDGCGRFMTMIQIVVPLLKPGVLAVGIYTFLQSWDDYLMPLIILTKTSMKTLPVGIAETFMGEFGFDYAGMMTISVVASMPVLLLFLFFNKYMISGLTGGAVKE